MLPSFVSFLNRLSLGHVFPFFCSAVETRAFLVVHVCFGVNPNLAVASARCGRFRRSLSVRALSLALGWLPRDWPLRRSPRFEQIAEIKLAR